MIKDRKRLIQSSFHIFLPMVLIFLLTFSLVKADVTYPKPNNLKYINDYTATIDKDTKEYVANLGKELEDKTSAQAVIVVIDSLQGKDINTYANELFRAWGIGQKGENNGLLILIVIKDRKWRVEVGTGLEGVVTDIYSARVMDNVAKPRFKEGHYSVGIREAYSIFAEAIAKEYSVTLDKKAKVNSTDNKNTGMATVIIVLVLILLDFIFNRGRITTFFVKTAFWTGRGGGGGGTGSWGGGNDSGSGGGFGGGSSSGGGSSGDW